MNDMMRSNLMRISAWMEEKGYGAMGKESKTVIIMAPNPDMDSDLTEIKIVLYLSDGALSLLAYAPISAERDRRLSRLLNQMNLFEDQGQFQYEENGSLLWCCHILLAEEWIGNEVLNEVLEAGCRNAGKLYDAFMNMDPDSADPAE
ncbi:MAG: hypothetical protein IJE08_01345 [Clostridia bacterium]|nr:hypothetical protein [Clostridia bacterium]